MTEQKIEFDLAYIEQLLETGQTGELENLLLAMDAREHRALY